MIWNNCSVWLAKTIMTARGEGMNSIIQNDYPLFTLYQRLREQLMAQLADGDLSFSPGGENPTLGELCREIGEVEQAYIDSFREQRQDFSYRYPDPSIATSVARLREWYGELDGALKEAILAFADTDVHQPLIDRGPDFVVSPFVQFQIYKEALLIFYGKVSVYLKAMSKARSEQWQDWIA
jgi:hypothetical protein